MNNSKKYMTLKNNLNYILTGLCVVFLGLGLLVNDPLAWFETSYDKSDLLISSLTKDTVTKIELYDHQAPLMTFERNDNVWNLKDTLRNVNYVADSSVVDLALDSLFSIRKYQEVTSNKEKFTDYDVDTNNFHIVVSSRDGVKYDLYLGRQASELNSTSVRLSNDTVVYAAKGNLKNNWQHSADYFRSKLLLKFIPDNIAKYTISGAYNYSLANANGIWTVTSGSAPVDIDTSKVLKLFSSISTLKGESFTENTDINSTKKYISIIFQTLSNETLTFDVFTKEKDTSNYFIKTSYLSDETQLAKWNVDNLTFKLDDLKKIANTSK